VSSRCEPRSWNEFQEQKPPETNPRSGTGNPSGSISTETLRLSGPKKTGRSSYLMSNVIKCVAIVVQAHQQIENYKNRKYGGVERVVASLIVQLLNRNVAVTLYTAKNSRLGCNMIYPIGVIDETFGQTIDPVRLETYSRKIREDLETRDFDIVNNHYDPITFSALQGIRIPTITTIHGPASNENINLFGKFPESYFSAVSQAQKNSYPSNMNFLGTGFVHNSIDTNHSFSDNKRNYLLSISRIQPSKGQSTAIEIAKKCGLDLVIAGNTTSKEYFQVAIQPHLSRDLSKPGGEAERVDFIDDISNHKTDGNSITYLGEVTGRERDHLMMYAKAFLFPIEVEEAFGMVLMEAGITGTPAIAFNRGAIPEIIEHGKTGFYGNTIDELVGFVGRVSEINPADCREHIEAHFNERRMVKGYLKLYREAVTAYQV